FFLSRCQLGLRGGSADRKVRADFALAGYAIDRAGDFTVDQHDALIALGNLREEFLNYVLLAIGSIEELHQRREIAPVGADAEHRPAGKAVQRLDHDLAMLGKEMAA